LFWDALHPTAAGQALIAEDAYAYVPEPGTFAVLAVGLAGLAVLRRRPTTAPAMVRSNRRS
jgi:phospholipase/lecithinase/hemolysin